MLTKELQRQVRELWDAFWSGGIANPLTAIEQITYLIFLKRLDEMDNLAMREGARLESLFAGKFGEEKNAEGEVIK